MTIRTQVAIDRITAREAFGPDTLGHIGLFGAVDPCGFNAGDTNLYRYVGDDPTNEEDPSGLEQVTEAGSPPPPKSIDNVGMLKLPTKPSHAEAAAAAVAAVAAGAASAAGAAVAAAVAVAAAPPPPKLSGRTTVVNPYLAPSPPNDRY